MVSLCCELKRKQPALAFSYIYICPHSSFKEREIIMHWIWVLIVGAIIGAIAGAITRRSGAMGWIGNIIPAWLVRRSVRPCWGIGVRSSRAWQSSHRLSARSLSSPLSRSSSCVQASDGTGAIAMVNRCEVKCPAPVFVFGYTPHVCRTAPVTVPVCRRARP